MNFKTLVTNATTTDADILVMACQRVIAQGKPSMVGSSGCKYLTKCGLKCAIGQLMDEEELEFASRTKYDLAVTDVLFGMDIAVSEERRAFLQQLQRCHDQAALQYRDGRIPDFREAFRRSVRQSFAIKMPGAIIDKALDS